MSIIDGLELEELQDRAKNADVYLRALTEILEICERVDQPRPETGRIADVARKALSSAISADGRAWLLGYPSAERLKKKYEK